jgi:hypothetical protein
MIGLIAATERDVYSIKVVRALSLIGCIVALPGLVACSAQTSTTDAEATQITALVEVDRTISDLHDLGHGEAIARFVRTRAGDEGALGLVSSSEIPAIGTCGTAPISSSPTTSVELLEVGSVTLEGAGVRTALVPRRLPDVVDLVSGVVYAARGPEEGSFGAGKYVLHVAGTADVPPFVSEADAPGSPTILRVGEQDLSSAIVIDGTTEIVWEPGSDRDLVVLETTGASKIVRCAFADNGHASLDASSFGTEGTITVRRIHREPFVAPGIDRGEIRFDFARVVSYRHR